MRIATPSQTTNDVAPDTLEHSVPSVPNEMNVPDRAAQHQKNEAARQLLREWLADDSGYDEDVWPRIKQIIDDNRLSMRSRFGD